MQGNRLADWSGRPIYRLRDYDRPSTSRHPSIEAYSETRWQALLRRVQGMAPTKVDFSHFQEFAEEQVSAAELARRWDVHRGTARRRIEADGAHFARDLVEQFVQPVLDSFIVPGGGTTLDAFTGLVVPPLPAWAVGLQRHSRCWPRTPRRCEVVGYLRQRAAEVFANLSEPRYVGAFHDADANRFWLDLTVLIEDRDEAIERGIREQQTAITQLASLETLYLRRFVWQAAVRGA